MTEPAAISSSLRSLLAGDPRSARVLAAFPRAAYLEVDGAPGRSPGSTIPAVVSLVASDGLAHPNSAVLAANSRDRPLRSCRPGTPATIGRGRIRVGRLDIDVARWWDPRPALGPIAAHTLRTRVGQVERRLAQDPVSSAGDPWCTPRLASDASAVSTAILGGDASRAAVAARRLVGFGPGLTPAGDDVLSGLLVAARTLRGALLRNSAPPSTPEAGSLDVDVLAAAAERIVEAAFGRTTSLSYTLLHHAARGEAAGPVADLLRVLAGGVPPGDRWAATLERLLAVGSTSGSDLALGMCVGARLALDMSSAAARVAGPRGPTVTPAPLADLATTTSVRSRAS